MRAICLYAALLMGCGSGPGSGGMATGGTGAEADAAGAALAGGADGAQAGPGGSGGSGGTLAGTGGVGGTAGASGGNGGGIGGSVAPSMDAAPVPPPDAGGAEPLYCPQIEGLMPAAGSCGFLEKSGTWTSMWKDGHPCAVCIAQGIQPTGCLITSPEGVGGEGPGPDLCVMNCRTECCYKRPEAVCDNDGQCCSPLRCVDNGPGKNKTCR